MAVDIFWVTVLAGDVHGNHGDEDFGGGCARKGEVMRHVWIQP